MTPSLRIVGIADTDSYVKWTAALLGSLSDAWDARMLVLRTPLVVSDSQLEAAVAGSGLAREQVQRIAHDEFGRALADADVVVLGARGPLVRVLARDAAALERRPAIATGLPGISVPATRKALLYRTQSDLFVVHSHREGSEFALLASDRGMRHRFALSRLPFAVAAEGARVGGGGADRAVGTDLVFAAQAKVPADRADRVRIARMLVAAALADPARRVVLKLRAARGEHQTHIERDAFDDLVAALGPVPANLVVETGPMTEALRGAAGMVTVSSTAAIEAVALGVPVIALDTFGVSPELINEVFRGSGLFGGERDVIERGFRHPEPEWLEQNYFHDPGDDDAEVLLAELALARRAGALPPLAPLARRGGALRDAWERKSVLGPDDRSVGGAVAYAVGLPSRAVVRAAQRARRLLSPPAVEPVVPGQQPGPEESSAHVSSTSAVRASTTRTP